MAFLVGAILAMAIVALVLSPGAWAAVSSVKVVGSSTTVRPGLPTPTAGAVTPPTPYKVTAAKNEFESFQVVIEAGDQPINGLRVDPGTQFENGTGATIANSNLTIYREGNYKVNTGFASDGEGGTGLWPDALIPTKDVFYGHSRKAFSNADTAFSLDVPAGHKIVAWVDVLVPKTAAAGDYTGSIVVSAASGLPQTTVPINLEVLNFEVPSTPSLDTVMDLNFNRTCSAHNNCEGGSEEQWNVHSMYVQAALDNRISIAKPGANTPKAGDNSTFFRKYELPMINGSTDNTAVRKSRLPGARVDTVFLYDFSNFTQAEFEAYIKDWKTEAEAGGFKDRVTFFCDELGSAAANWDRCKARLKTARGIWGPLSDGRSLPFATTNTIDAARQYGGDYEPGRKLVDEVDIFIPIVNYMHNKPGQPVYVGNQRPNYEPWRTADANNRVWMYTSCMSFACDETMDAYHDGWPGYAIDAPATQSRAMGWLSFTYDASGEYYYETVAQLPTAWDDGGQYSEGANGDGTLFYPGTSGPGGKIGGPAGTDIPVESIRLKRIRDGREDYEYLKYLADNGKKTEAESVAKSLFPVMYDTTATQTELDNARNQLIASIKNLDPKGGDVELTSITDSPDPVDAGSNLTYDIKVTNTSANYMAHDVKISDVLPADVTFVSASDGCTFNQNTSTVGCDVGPITGGGGTSGAQIVVRPTAAGTITNTATVSSLNDPNSANNSKSAQTQVNGGGATCQGLVPTPDVTRTVKEDGTEDGTVVLTGTSGNDVILGDAAEEQIFGLGGDDKICGGGGFDTLSGGLGDDTLDGGDNSPKGDALEYGRQSGEGSPVSGSVKVDLPNRRVTGTGIGTDTLLSGFAEVYGSAQADTIIGDGEANYLSGIGGNDLLMGGGGDDTIDGGADRDTVSYEDARAGVSVSLTYSEAFDRPNVGGDAGIGHDSFIGTSGQNTNENVRGSAYGDSISGNARANVLYGLGGADIINGEGAGDTARGGEGKDRLIGTSGVAVDRLYGEGGDDTLNAWDNRANDVLDGGTHATRDACTADGGDVSRNCNP